MIRKTIGSTQLATFAVLLPNAEQGGMPTPMGSGFFVSAQGYFITASHVVGEMEGDTWVPRPDIDRAVLEKAPEIGGPPQMLTKISLHRCIPAVDVAILKVDLDANADKAWLKEYKELPHLKVSQRSLEIGEPVYSYGYPLSSGGLIHRGNVMVGTNELNPRLTSAIVSSNLEKTQMFMSSGDVRLYVIDKALNYGNSGGPIVATETGNAHAICSRLQPVRVPQNLQSTKFVTVPSLYGIVTSLNNDVVVGELEAAGVPLTSD